MPRRTPSPAARQRSNDAIQALAQALATQRQPPEPAPAGSPASADRWGQVLDRVAAEAAKPPPETRKLTAFVFDRPGALLEWIEAHIPLPGADASSVHGNTGDPRWDDSLGYDGALHAARHGFPTGKARIQGALDALAPHLQAPEAPRPLPDVQGPYFDPGRYVEGDPECFMSRQAAPTRDPVVIAVNMSAIDGTSSESIAARGAAAAALALALRDLGVPSELWAYNANGPWSMAGEDSDPDGNLLVAVRVATIEAHMDADTLGFWLGSAAWFRRLGFAVRERWSAERTRNGYGITQPSYRQVPGLLDPHTATGRAPDVDLPYSREMPEWTPGLSAEWVRRELVRLGLSTEVLETVEA